MIQALFRDALVYGVAAAVSRGLGLLALPIYTKVLSPSDYGALDIIMVIGSLANLLVALEISQALARMWQEAGDFADQRRMFTTAAGFTVAAYLLFLMVCQMGAPLCARLLFGTTDIEPALRIGFLFISVNGVFLLLQNQLRFEHRSRAYAGLSVLYAVLTLGGGALLAFGLGMGLLGVLWSQFLAATVATGVGAWLLRPSFRGRFDCALLHQMLRFSLPLVPSGAATFLTLYANRLLLNSSAELIDVGLFGVAARIGGATSLIIIGFQAALTPLIYAHYKEPQTPGRLARIVEGFVGVALLASLTVGVLASQIIGAFATPEYLAAAPAVLPLAGAALFNQMYIFFPGIALSKRTMWQLYIFALSAILSIALNWLFIEAWGMAGAAWATLAASVAFMILWIAASQKLYHLPVSWTAVAAATGVTAVCVVAVNASVALVDAGPRLVLAKLGILLLATVGVGACFITKQDLCHLRRLIAHRDQ